jgi:hypothetical protein
MTEMLNMQKLLDAGKREYPNLSMDELMSFIQMGINMKKESTMKKVKKAKGGNVSSQMEMFEEGGLKDDGGSVDPISGNDVPPGSTQEEVRDDIPAQLSEGEFVFPADVVRYIGLQNLMQMRQQAKVGLKEMEDMGQMGNSEEATMADDMPFDINDIDMQDEEEYNSDREMAKGGVVYAATGFSGTTTNAPGLTMKKSSFDNTAARNPTPEYKAPPIPTAAPSGGFKYGTGNKTETTTSYDKLVGGVGADEYRTYVNDAGAEIQVPFKSGQMLTGYVLPEGYRPKSADKVETAKTQSTQVKTARVDSGDGGPDPRDSMTTTTLGGTVDSKGRVSGGTTYGLGYDIPGFNPLTAGIPGIIAMGVALATGNAPKGTTVSLSHLDANGNPVGSKVTGIDINDWNSARTVNGKTSITNPKAVSFNNIVKASAKFDNDVKFKDLKAAYVDKSKSAVAARVEESRINMEKATKTEDRTPTFEPMTKADLDRHQAGTITPSGISYVGDDPVANPYGDDNNNDGNNTDNTDNTESTVGDDPSGPGDGGVGSDDGAGQGGEDVAKGSLITKRKASGKLKPQYKKQGGLASRK